MKLYFYYLSQPLGEKPRIEVEECEVEEKPKTYSLVTGFPKFYCGCYAKKEDIGRLIGYNRDIVALTEKNTEKAAEVFKEKFALAVARAKNDIKYAKERIERHNALIDMVDDWRLENETH